MNKVKVLLSLMLLMVIGLSVSGQDPSPHIVVDQFGYLPSSRKLAVIRNPMQGFDADQSFSPGKWYALVDALSGELVYRAEPSAWKGGAIDESSGDMAWHFDFSSIREAGSYYVLDQDHNVRSFEFRIAEDVYNEVLRQAMRSFFYQRAGFAKEAPYADEGWVDGASHSGDLQDNNCRSWYDKLNPDTERDVSGGWYDAGDFNKYTNWTARYVVELLKAYTEKPEAWGDDYNIPESGNGRPDILDEAIWGVDHLLRMQLSDGAVLSIVDEDHASPPSSANEPSYYGPPNTSATLNTAAAFAMASGVFKSQGLVNYADTLLSRSKKAWDWAGLYPDSIWNNNSADNGSSGCGAGQQEINDYGRFMARLKTACYLYEQTGDVSYRDYFDAHYQEVHMMQWNFVFPYEADNQEILLYYTTLAGATPSVSTHIADSYRNGILTGSDNMPAYRAEIDPYIAHTDSYVWGSNGVLSSQGSMSFNLLSYELDEGVSTEARDAAESFIHKLHGVNPLNLCYLSNMYSFGGDQCVNEFYHTWFTDGSPLWDRVGTSVYGPAPGFLPGGPNPGYDVDGCCPSGCGSSSNNSKCIAESLSPPKGQPKQKSYKDFNTSWPVNSWSVTENSCGYQVRYIRLLSKFVTAGMDCSGDIDGGAFIDSCGVCAGGGTGIEPSLDPDNCNVFEPAGDTMYIEGRHLWSASGEKVVLRGVNEMFVWSDDETGTLWLPEIARTGANCVRMMWMEERGEKDILVDLIENCIKQDMIAMPECHSATGEWDKLDVCINFWKDPVLLEGIQRNKRWTLLNIGNEVGDGSVTSQQFSEGYTRAIDSLRGWGYTVPLVIDASTWGQNVDVILDTWEELLEHDPLHNILFSVHSYWSDTRNYSVIANESVNNGLPVIIGEGPSPSAYPVCGELDYQEGLQVCGENEIGWLIWSWGGKPNGHCLPKLDLTVEGEFGKWVSLPSAQMAVDHPFSLMRTSIHPPSFYADQSVPAKGIYLSPDVEEMTIGDTLYLEVLVAPLNAVDHTYDLEISGETNSVTYDPLSGMLVALTEGEVMLTATAAGGDNIQFSRALSVKNIPVEEVVISPSSAEMLTGDTLSYTVDILPENATNRDYWFLYEGEADVYEQDSAKSRIFAMQAGMARLIVRSVSGSLSDTLHISVTDPVSGGISPERPSFKVYPNPNKGLLRLECGAPEEVNIQLLDLNGKVILSSQYRVQTEIDTKHLAAGTYVLVQRWNDKVERHKLILY
ncbi:MAG: glycoside hydrolase family 9 protein [Bacteroides sp.]|nr:glycoside hydrolase family 9 protein [Bacteroides sp.]